MLAYARESTKLGKNEKGMTSDEEADSMMDEDCDERTSQTPGTLGQPR